VVLSPGNQAPGKCIKPQLSTLDCNCANFSETFQWVWPIQIKSSPGV